MSARSETPSLSVPQPAEDAHFNEPDGLGDQARDDFTDEARAALAAVDAHAKNHLDAMLRFGKALSNAKAVLKHGEFSPWCVNVLKRSPSWCSAHRRLHESRNDLEPARDWARANNHKWANCLSVERLLKIVADWKKATRGDCVTALRARRKKRAVAAPAELEEIAAGLREILAEAEEAFETVRYELWWTAPSNDGLAKEELMALAKRFRSRLHELAESCSALQVSKAVEAAAPPPIKDVPDAGLPQRRATPTPLAERSLRGSIRSCASCCRMAAPKAAPGASADLRAREAAPWRSSWPGTN